MFVTWKRVKPDTDIGFNFSREYQAALSLERE